MNFDRIATHYRWLEAVLAGGVLQRCRTVFIARTRQARSALFLGEGNGRFLAPFLKGNATARVVCVEQSQEMIFRAGKALERRGIDPDRMEFICADVRGWAPPAKEFDLIVSHFFLDCFTQAQLERLIPKIARSGKPGCLWLLADFQLPDGGLRKVRARAIHKLMYAFFRVATGLAATRLTPPDSFLRRSGFRLADRITVQWGLLRSDCWILSANHVDKD